MQGLIEEGGGLNSALIINKFALRRELIQGGPFNRGNTVFGTSINLLASWSPFKV